MINLLKFYFSKLFEILKTKKRKNKFTPPDDNYPMW
jgi:hypothetical protein